jgi:hypothetical protein
MCAGGACRDVLLPWAITPDCDYDAIDDPQRCPSCVKDTDCEQPCGGDTCRLCPGQTVADLPAGCSLECVAVSDCPAGEWCATGTCIAVPLL